jgi:hypothetical protein
MASMGHARRPSRVATRGSLRMVVGPGGKGLACERDPTIMRDRRAACQVFGSGCRKPQRTQKAQKGLGLCPFVLVLVLVLCSCSCSCSTGWGIWAEGETSTRNCEQECDPEWTEASFASFAGRSPRRTTKPKAKSIRTRNGGETTEDAEGTEGCVRSWVVRVAPGSARSWFSVPCSVFSVPS